MPRTLSCQKKRNLSFYSHLVGILTNERSEKGIHQSYADLFVGVNNEASLLCTNMFHVIKRKVPISRDSRYKAASIFAIIDLQALQAVNNALLAAQQCNSLSLSFLSLSLSLSIYSH